MAMAADGLQDDLAVSLAPAIVAENKQARGLGVDAVQSLITITQQSSDSEAL